MRFPDKITSYKESVFRVLPLILDELSRSNMPPADLYELIADKISLLEYIEALDCLYALGKVDLVQSGEVLHYVT